MSYFALNKLKNSALIAVFFVTPFLIDQYSKSYFLKNNQTYFCNSDFSLGINFNIPYFWLILAILLILLGYLYIYAFQKDNFWWSFWGILFFSSAFSNLYDRFTLGCVIDFIPFIRTGFFIFNLADLFIFIATLGLIKNIYTKI